METCGRNRKKCGIKLENVDECGASTSTNSHALCSTQSLKPTKENLEVGNCHEKNIEDSVLVKAEAAAGTESESVSGKGKGGEDEEKKRRRRRRNRRKKKNAAAQMAALALLAPSWMCFDEDDDMRDMLPQICCQCWGYHPCPENLRFCTGDYDWTEEPPTEEDAMIRTMFYLMNI